MYKIVQAPDKILRSATQPVRGDVSKIIEEMRETLLKQSDPDGVGLAANQVGLPYRLFLARFDVKKPDIRVFINPEILEQSGDFQEEVKKTPLEGCLSLPKYYGYVQRKKWIKLKFNDGVVETFTGFPATVIQHEMDHLDGKIFVERILEQKGKLFKVTGKDKKGKEEWEEIEL